MNRYTKSLLITVIIYITLTATFIYSNSFKVTDKEQSSPKEAPLKISIIQFEEPPKPVVKKQTIESKQKPKLPKKEKIVKKEPIKAIKKIVKKVKTEPEKIVKKQHTERKNETAPILSVANPIVKKTIEKPILKPSLNKVQVEKQKKEYYSKIKQIINEHKSYPRIAVKRGIEGLIKIKFTLSNTGELLSYHIIEGKNIFKKSLIKAIQQSFPLLPPPNIFTSDIDISLTLEYKLY
jgi:periplasmic protein TonB